MNSSVKSRESALIDLAGQIGFTVQEEGGGYIILDENNRIAACGRPIGYAFTLDECETEIANLAGLIPRKQVTTINADAGKQKETEQALADVKLVAGQLQSLTLVLWDLAERNADLFSATGEDTMEVMARLHERLSDSIKGLEALS